MLNSTPMFFIQILTALQRLLFLNGFTVSTPPNVIIAKHEIPPKHKVDTRFLWKGGVGAVTETISPATPAMLKARTEVLRCLLACLSSTLYTVRTVKPWRDLSVIRFSESWFSVCFPLFFFNLDR